MSNSNDSSIPVSIVIPTYCRDKVLLDSVISLLNLDWRADEILVVDQSPGHETKTRDQLQDWHDEGGIKWIKLDRPSITAAMNHGLRAANRPLVLFLDDDIEALPGLVENHFRTHQHHGELWVTVGQVIQPWQQPEAIMPPRHTKGLRTDFDFPFNSTIDADVQNVMAGNLCVNRERAISTGGFDENFVGTAYRFETDFARRIIAAGGKIHFVGSAGIKHLRAESGGTRSLGNHMASSSPLHGFGDYYYAFRHAPPGAAWAYSVQRFFREVRTKFHLTRPWWIPVKLVGEAGAIIMARRAVKSGPSLIGRNVVR